MYSVTVRMQSCLCDSYEMNDFLNVFLKLVIFLKCIQKIKLPSVNVTLKVHNYHCNQIHKPVLYECFSVSFYTNCVVCLFTEHSNDTFTSCSSSRASLTVLSLLHSVHLVNMEIQWENLGTTSCVYGSLVKVNGNFIWYI